jgi:hypothetical protein
MKESTIPAAPATIPSTPSLYMTPHLAKRKDGLCPSLLFFQGIKKDKPGSVSKQYQTNSSYLLQIPEKEGVSREVLELQTIVESLNELMKLLAKPGTEISSTSFKHEGCIWKLALDPDRGEASKAYKVEVTCLASSMGGGKTNYVIDTVMTPRFSVNPDPFSPDPPGFKEAKDIFDSLVLKVRKAVVRLEFPSFPEGCKGVPFREVYQLNARVRICCRRCCTNVHNIV